MKIHHVEFEEEACCEICMEVVHVHVNKRCPVCKELFAGTSINGPIIEELDGANYSSCNGTYECEECDAKFQILWYGDPFPSWDEDGLTRPWWNGLVMEITPNRPAIPWEYLIKVGEKLVGYPCRTAGNPYP